MRQRFFCGKMPRLVDVDAENLAHPLRSPTNPLNPRRRRSLRFSLGPTRSIRIGLLSNHFIIEPLSSLGRIDE
jgi:hypothetical protein